MRSALTAEQYNDFLQQRQAPTGAHDVYDKANRPGELTDYLKRLKEADLLNARASRAGKSRHPKRIGNLSAAEHWRYKSQHHYELACERLEEILDCSDNQRESEIRAWLDRDFDMSTNGTISIDCDGVARVIGSRSPYCRITAATANGDKKKHWTQCAQDALEHAAHELLYAPVEVTPAQTQQLQSMLSQLKTVKR